MINHTSHKYYDYTDLEYCDKCIQSTTYKIKELSRPYNIVEFSNDPSTINPLSDVIYTTNIEAFAKSPYATVTKYKSAITKVTTPNAVIRNSNLMFMFDPTTDELTKLQELFQTKFNINFISHDTLSQVGDQLMHQYNCYQHLKYVYKLHLNNHRTYQVILYRLIRMVLIQQLIHSSAVYQKAHQKLSQTSHQITMITIIY